MVAVVENMSLVLLVGVVWFLLPILGLAAVWLVLELFPLAAILSRGAIGQKTPKIFRIVFIGPLSLSSTTISCHFG